MCLYILSPLSLSLSLSAWASTKIYISHLSLHFWNLLDHPKDVYFCWAGPCESVCRVPFGLWKICIFGSIESWNGFCFKNIGHGKEKSSLLFIHFCYFCESCLTFKIFVFGFVVGFGFCKLNCTAHWLESDGFFRSDSQVLNTDCGKQGVIDNHLQFWIDFCWVTFRDIGVSAHVQWHSSEQEQRIKEAIENWPLNPASVDLSSFHA